MYEAESNDMLKTPLAKFAHPDLTVEGEARAHVDFVRLDTLWVNTGTLCNVECAHCYIESSPKNDRLTYLSIVELAPFLDEAHAMNTQEIAFTGGEPFMNPNMIKMAEDALARGFNVLILTNAMQPMMRPKIQAGLLKLHQQFGDKLSLRVSLDHFSKIGHDKERGPGSFAAAMIGLCWLRDNDLQFTIAGRSLFGESEPDSRNAFAALFREQNIQLDADDPASLIIFPEMDASKDVPEITSACWSIMDKSPTDVMCANSRMLAKRKGAPAPVVLSCTLLPYDTQFEMGSSLAEATSPVKLNHPFCAQFCVLGGASCST